MNGNDLTRLNEIICPICHRDSVIEINEFKVSFECFEGHESSDICLDEFGGTRMVGESDVLMDLNLENCCGIHGEKKNFYCENCCKNICNKCSCKHYEKQSKLLYIKDVFEDKKIETNFKNFI